jgi:hypothetical protein
MHIAWETVCTVKWKIIGYFAVKSMLLKLNQTQYKSHIS